MSTTQPSPGTAAAEEFVPVVTGRRRSAALIVVLLASFMDLLDTTIVNVALPRIHRDLGGAYSDVQWIAAGYALAFSVLLITGGRLGDIFGRKRLFLVGITGFTIASALCGASQSTGELIAARVAQGALAAMMVPQVLSVIQVMYPPKDRGKAIGMFGALAGVATVGGPILGALLTTGNLAGLSWRSIFYVNVPVGVISVVLAAVFVPESTAPNARRLDLPGVALVTAALVMLVYPLVDGANLGWPAWTFALMAGSLVVLAAFAAYQRARAPGSPLVELSLFGYRSFTGGLVVSLLFMGGVIGYFLVFTIYLQTGLGFGVLRAGLTSIPWGLTVPMFAGISVAVLAARVGRPLVQLGLLLDIAAMIALMLITGHTHVTSLVLAPALAVGGIGMGMVVGPLVDFSLADVPLADAGSASGLFNTIQQLGAAIGIAAVGAYFLAGIHPGPPSPTTFTPAFQHTLWLPVGAFAVALAATFLMPARPGPDPPGRRPSSGTAGR